MDTLASVDLVRNVEIFSRLTERHLEATVHAGRLTTMRAGTRLLKAGVVPADLSVVLSGHVRVVDERGEAAIPFDVLGPGAHFGETLLESTPAPFSIYAQSDVELLALGRRELDRLAVEWPDIEGTLLDHLARRHRFNQDFELITALDGQTGERDLAHARLVDGAPGNAAFGVDGRIEWRRREFVPRRRARSVLVPQVRPSDSGPACLASVCRHYGRRVTLNALREASDSVRADASLTGLRRAADSIGFETLAATVTWRELAVNAFPTIVQLTGRHWVTVFDATDDRVVV